MRRIVEYRKLLGVTKETSLKDMKTIYRNLMKEFHPDKIQDNEALKLEVEEKSKKIILAYDFLVSIAPETIEATLAEYTDIIANCNILDYHYKAQVLTVEFSNGSKYEYYGVTPKIYSNMVNSGAVSRFARRNIFTTFTYRQTIKPVEVEG
jgi:curved DNA-binding protein CbpA